MTDKVTSEATRELSNLYEAELIKMDKRVKEIRQENDSLKKELIQTRYEFNQLTGGLLGGITSGNHIKKRIRKAFAYILGRRDRRQLYSKAYKKKKAKNTLKSYSYYLYSLGFEERIISELIFMYSSTKNRYLKKEAAWELLLWFANRNTALAAETALNFVEAARDRETDSDALRKIDILEMETLLRLHRKEDAQLALQSLMQRGAHPDNYLTVANLESELPHRITWINKCLKAYNLLEVSLSPSQKPTDYDRLQTIQESKVKQGETPLVSVIVPVFNSEKTIITTLDSLTSQTWDKLEIIIVDDKSTDQTITVVEEYIKKHNNITLYQNQVNSGPYVCRNRGLTHASGEFITVNDADDWSHAQKIELQVKHLLNNKDIVGNMSQQARVHEDLTFTRRGMAGSYIFPNMSSLMFRRQIVLEKLGYWDEVRFAGDSEFISRLKQTFGNNSVINLDIGPLSFTRQTENSLTGSNKFGYSGHLKGARKEYAEAFRYFHQEANSLYFPLEQKERPFPIPHSMKAIKLGNAKHHYDIIIACDYRYSEEQLNEIIKEIKELRGQNYDVALLQLDEFDFSISKHISPKIRSIMEEMDIPLLVYGEKVSCEVVLIRKAEVLFEKQAFIPEVTAATVTIIIDRAFFSKVKQRRKPINSVRKCSQQAFSYFGQRGNWYPKSREERRLFEQDYSAVLKYIRLSKEDWYITGRANSFVPHLRDLVVRQDKFEEGADKSERE